MKFIESMDEFVKSVEATKQTGEALKLVYLDLITDKNIPLDERWNVFTKAPSFWQEHDLSVPSFSIEAEREINWYDDFNIEKRETVDLIDIIKQLEEDIKRGFATGWTLELANQLKEDILKQNLGSFEYDW